MLQTEIRLYIYKYLLDSTNVTNIFKNNTTLLNL